MSSSAFGGSEEAGAERTFPPSALIALETRWSVAGLRASRATAVDVLLKASPTEDERVQLSTSWRWEGASPAWPVPGPAPRMIARVRAVILGKQRGEPEQSVTTKLEAPSSKISENVIRFILLIKFKFNPLLLLLTTPPPRSHTSREVRISSPSFAPFDNSWDSNSN